MKNEQLVKKEIKRILKEFAQAMRKGDQATFDRLVAKDWLLTEDRTLVGIAPQVRSQLNEKARVHSELGLFLTFKTFTYVEAIIVVWGDTAVVSSLLTIEGIHGELVVRKNSNRVTDVWVRQAEQ